MITDLLLNFPQRIHAVLKRMQTFEETGHLGIDNVSLKTRGNLKELGVL
jgi:hypothetical protein